MNEELLRELHKILGGGDENAYNEFKNEFSNSPELQRESFRLLGGGTDDEYNGFLTEIGIGQPTQIGPKTNQPTAEPKYSSAREESIAKFGFDWASPTTDLPTPYAKKEKAAKKQVLPKTNFPSSFSIGPGMVSNIEITPEQLERNKEQVQLNTYQAEVDRISEANETLAFFNPDQYAKFKVPSTISEGFIQTPPTVDFKNETTTPPVIEKLGPDGEVNINQARENFKIDVGALRQKQEASKKLMDLDLGEQWSDEYVNSLDTHHLLVDAITPLADKIESKYGKANSGITVEQKNLIEKGSILRDSIDSRSLQLQDTQKKIELLNKGYEARAAEAKTQEDIDALNQEYKSAFDELDIQQKLIITDLDNFAAEIDVLRQTEANIIGQNKMATDEYSKDEDVRKYNDLYKKYSENLDKIDKYRSHPMFKDYVGATNSLNEIKGAGKNLFRDEIEVENRGRKMQEVADFYTKNTAPKQSAFDNIRTDLAFAFKSIIQDEPAVGPISIGVNKLKDAAFNFSSDVVSVIASAADVVGTSLGAPNLGADLRYNDFLSAQTLKSKRTEVESAIRSDVKGGFSMKLLDIDPVFARSNGLDQGTKLVLDNDKVIGYRDQEGFTKEYLLPPGIQQNVTDYAKQNEDKAENDYSFARGVTETLPSALDFVQLMYFGGALTKGVTKLGLSKAAAAPASVFGISTFQMYGDSYSDYIAKGLEPTKAAKYALGKSAAVSLVETLASPMEARMVAGGASDVVLANFRRVRDTTADLIATGRLGTRDAFSALGSAAGAFYKDLGLENVTELIQSDIENAVDNNALNEQKSMNFNEMANIVFATTAITLIPGFMSGASAYNKAKADITTTAIWNSTQNVEDFNKYTEELTKLNKLSVEDAAGIKAAVSYVKEELDQYDGTTKENAVGATGLILTRRALEAKLANTGNQRAKDIISTKIDGLNTQIDQILGGKAKVEIDEDVKDIFTEEKGKEATPTKGSIEYKAGAEPEVDYKVGDPIIIGGEQRVITDVVLNEEGNITSVSYDSDVAANTDTAAVVADTTETPTPTPTETLVEETPTTTLAQEQEAIVEDVPPVTEAEIQTQQNIIATAPEIKSNIDNLANDNYLFTHVTTEDNARNIIEGGMSISVGTGISSTLTQLNANGVNDQISRLQAGEVVHRDLNNNSVAVISVPKAELDAIQGKDIAEKFELWLAENNMINESGQYSIPTDFNAGYLTKEGFVGRSGANTNTTLQGTQNTEQGVSTTAVENVQNTAPASTNTVALPSTLTGVTLTNKSGGQTTGNYTYNEEKQTWSKVNENGKKTPVNSPTQIGQLNNLRNNTTNEEESTSNQQTNNNQESNPTTEEGKVDTTLGQEGEVTTQNDGKTAQLPNVSTKPITEAEVETLLEEIGKDSKAREEQIYKFFALPAALGDKTKAIEIARITNILWENVAKQLGKRSGKTADAWIKARVAMLGKTSVEDARARGNTRFQVIGEQGAAALDQAQEVTTRLNNLAVAKEMEAANKDAKVIRLATGWEKSVDNKWQYETDTELDIKRFIVPNKSSATIPLREVVVFDELQKAYPDVFESANIVFTTIKGGAYMSAMSKDGVHTIYINKNKVFNNNGQISDKPKFVRSIAHELQHIISNIEGFQRGSNFRNAETRIQQDISRLKGTAEGREIERLYNDDKTREGLVIDYYLRSAGEVQARNVEERFDLSPEQRRQNLLQETEDVAREDQIIIQDGIEGLANSIAAGNVSFQSNNTDSYTTAEAATAVANNLITELDRMIAERSDKDAIKARGWTMAQAAADLKNLRAVKAELQKNMKDPKWQVDAYHGTPYVFDRFTTDKIGTGEGAQAFGWGLYFTDLKSIAKNYAEKLSRKGSEIGWEDYATISDKKLLQNNPSLSDFETIKNKTLVKLKKGIKFDTFYGPKHFENLVTQLESDTYSNYKYKAKSKPSKNIYKVSLHKGKTPDQYTWLEWDKELSKKQIQDLLNNDIDGSIAEALTNYYTENNDISTTKELIDTMYNGSITGKELYGILQENVGENPSDKAASIALLNAGIDGVKYPAESISRGLTSDNARGFNYVVFDENAVTIEERVQFQQEAAQFRAAAIEVAKNQVIIAALDAPNESSFVHEMAHSFEPDLTTEERQTFIDDYNEQFSDNTKDWNTDVSEFFARAWEKYLSNGRKVTPKEVKDPKKRGIIQEVFDKFTEYLQGIYNGVITYNNTKGITKPIEVSPAVKAVFDNIMGIKSAEERISRLIDEDKIDELRADVGMDTIGFTDKGVPAKLRRYAERAMRTASISEDLKKAIMEGYVPKEKISDEEIQAFADAFVAELQTEEDLLAAVPELLQSFSDKIARANTNVGPWELRAIKQIDRILNDQYSPEAAADVFRTLDNVFSQIGGALREAGINNEDSLFIQLYGRARNTEAPLFEAESSPESGVTNEQVFDSIIEMYEQATAEVRQELRDKIAAEIRKAKPKAEFSKETPPAPPKLSKILNDKANAYLESFNNRISTGFSSGFDIEALQDYALYAFYKSAGSIVKAKEILVKKFGQAEVDQSWDTISTSEQFIEATIDIARQKLIAAIETPVNNRLDNRGMTPPAMVISAIKRKLAKDQAKPRAEKKTLEQVLEAKDLDISFVTELRADIRSGLLPLDEATKAETMNAVDDLLITLVQDKVSTIAAPWVTKTKTRELVKNSLDSLHLTIDNLVKDIVTKNTVVKSLTEEFIQRTGLTQQQAKPYLDIIKVNIDELINKRVEDRLNKLFTESYGKDIVEINKAIVDTKAELDQNKADYEAKKIELDQARKAKDPNADTLQKERDYLAASIKSNTKRLVSLKAASKKGLRFVGTAAANVAKKPTIEKIGDVVRNGGLSRENIREVFAESIGAKSFTRKDADTLRDLFQKYDNAQFNVDKEKSLEDISEFVFALSEKDKRTFIEMWEGFMYANMLGAFKTTDVAFSSGVTGFIADELTSISIQLGKDIKDLITGKGADFTNTRLIFDAAKNVYNNSSFRIKTLREVALGKKGLAVTDINNDKQNRFNTSLTGIKKLRILRDEARKAGNTKAVIVYNSLIYHQISARGLMMADYAVQANGIPYELHRNLADTARAELLKEGYLNPRYAQIIDRVNKKLGADKVAQQLEAEGFTKGTIEYNDRRAEIIYEFLPEQSMDKMLAEDTMARIAFTGRLSGFSGAAVSAINKAIYAIGNKGKELSSNDQDTWTSLIAATLLKMSTAPFFGASFRVAQRTKNYTPFGLLQWKTREERQQSFSPVKLFEEYRYYNLNTGQVEVIPASPHAKEIRYANAILPTILFTTIMLSALDYDDEDDTWTLAKDTKHFYTAGYSPAMKRKIELSGETYEPYTVYEKTAGGKFKRLYNYKENTLAWPLAVIGRIQERLIYDVEESVPSGGFDQVAAKDPLNSIELLGTSLRAFTAFSSQGAIESSVGTVGAVAPLLEGGEGDAYAAKKMLSGLVRMNTPLSALEAEMDNYYSLVTKAGRKKGTTPVTDVFDRMLIFNPLFDNYDYDVIGRKITQQPYGPVITTGTTKMVDGLLAAANQEREMPEVEALLLKYSDIDKIKTFKFKPIKDDKYKQTIVELPEDPQQIYDVQFGAAKKKGQILTKEASSLDRLKKIDLEKGLEKINTEANQYAQNEYLRQVLTKAGKANLHRKELKKTKKELVKENLFIDKKGNVVKLKVPYLETYEGDGANE